MSGHALLAAVIFILLAQSVIESKNVVFLPMYGPSHVRKHAFVGEELTKMGHKVWLGVPPDLDKRSLKSYPGLTTFDLNEFWDVSLDELIFKFESTFFRAHETGTDPDFQWISDDLERNVSQHNFQAITNGTYVEYIRSLKPDLIVLDWFPRVNENVILSHMLKVPFAILSAFQHTDLARVPINPMAEVHNSLYFRTQATLFEKVQAVIQIMSPMFKHFFNDRGYMKLLFPDDPDVPATNELLSQAEVYIVESDPIVDYARPSLPNFKLVGGLSTGPSKELQEPFKSFVEKSQKAGIGVMVFSFGSLIMNLPKDIEVKLVSALKRIKLNTIWRFNITSPDPDKILVTSWLPQNDLLGHKNVKVFMTHTGAHSMYEGIYHGVPMICLPLFYDQIPNAERTTEKGYSVTLDLMKTSEDHFVKAIEEVASSQKIRSTIGNASEIYRQLYPDAKKEAAFWLDHVMRYGGSYMRYSGQKIPMYMFLMDYFIMFLAGLVFAVGLFLICFVIKRVCMFCFRPRRHLKKD